MLELGGRLSMCVGGGWYALRAEPEGVKSGDAVGSMARALRAILSLIHGTRTKRRNTNRRTDCHASIYRADNCLQAFAGRLFKQVD